MRLDRQAPGGQRRQRGGLRGQEARRIAVGGDHLVGEHAQPARRHQARIQRAHGPRRRVARIGEHGLVVPLALLVDPRKRAIRQVDLAANLETCRRDAAQAQRNRPDGPDVDRHVFALHAIAAGDAPDEAAVLIGQRDAESVDLQLRDVGDARVGVEAQALPHPLVERAQLALVVGVVEAQQRLGMGDGREALCGPPRHPLRRRLGRDEQGMLDLERHEFAHERVELGVGDLGIGVDVVALFVVPDALAQRRNLFGGGHRAASARVSDRGRPRSRAATSAHRVRLTAGTPRGAPRAPRWRIRWPRQRRRRWPQTARATT